MRVVLLAMILFAGYPQEKERALGRQLAAEVERLTTPVSDREIGEFVNGVTRKVAAQCAPGMPVEARVISAEEANAFGLPGGYLLVNSGLVRGAGNEAELAGVLAFLSAHLRSAAAGRARLPLILTGGWTGFAYRPSPGITVPPGMAAAYREAVRKADAEGLRCLSAAGYDPETYLDGLRKFAAAPPGSRRSADLYPPPGERVESVRALLASLIPGPRSAVDTSAFSAVRTRLEQLYPARAAGAARPPSLRR